MLLRRGLWVVLRKWLNLGAVSGDSDFSADEGDTAADEPDHQEVQKALGLKSLTLTQTEANWIQQGSSFLLFFFRVLHLFLLFIPKIFRTHMLVVGDMHKVLSVLYHRKG